MEWDDFHSEFNKQEIEINSAGENENNVFSITNDYDRKDVFSPLDNHSNEKEDNNISLPKETKNKPPNPFRIVTTFVAACAVATAVSPIVDIPILQDLVVPSQPAIVETVDAQYEFSSLSSTSSVIRCGLTITGVDDIKSQDYGLVLVKPGDGNEDFLMSIGKTKIDTCKVSISTANSFSNITTYLSSKGYDDLVPNSNYDILLLKGMEIVKKYSSFATTLPTYFDSIYAQVYSENELRVYYTLSSDFAFCSRLSFELYDHDGHLMQWIAQDIPAVGDPSFVITGKLNNPAMTHTIKVFYQSPVIIPGLPSAIQEDGQTYYYIYSINIDF